MTPIRPTHLPVLAALLLAPATAADAASVHVDYAITLGGLSIGNASLDGTVDDARYDVRMSGRLTGIVGALSGGSTGGASARGSVGPSRVMSNGFSASARSSTNERTVSVAMQGGTVGSVSIVPPFERNYEVVPLGENDRRNVVDPLSGVLAVQVNKAKLDDPANCNRTLPVFDGTQRFDITLSYAGTRLVRRPGFTGNVLVCAIRYSPVAGHRKDRPSVQFMKDNRDMQVWLAPVEGARVMVPIRIAVQTMLGMSIVDAQTWTVSGEPPTR